MNIAEFEKMSGISYKDFCKKTGVKYKNLVRDLARGSSMLSPKGSNKYPLYRIYKDITKRCYNSNSCHYKNYGARGIKMSGEFFYSFKAFADYMGDRPGARYSIDRIDNDGNYERGNLRWATQRQQTLNRRPVKENPTGHIGIQKRGNKYRGRFNYFYKKYNTAPFESIDNAICSMEILRYRVENGFYF